MGFEKNKSAIGTIKGDVSLFVDVGGAIYNILT